MRRKAPAIIAIALLICATCITSAAATEVTVTDSYGAEYTIGSDELAVRVNGDLVEFPDARPFIDDNNRTLIPVRFVAESMGADVDWDNESRTATIERDGITILVPIGSDTISITENGVTEYVTMDTEAIISESRTYVPIRFVAESLSAWVSWSDLYSTVQIYDDVLTPEEIDRLHAYYDTTWEEYFESIGESSPYTNEKIEQLTPEIGHFEGTYGFENAAEYKLRYPNGSDTLKYPDKPLTSYTGLASGKSFTFGTQPDTDFAKLVLAEAYGVEDELNAHGKATISLHADLSCVYYSRHSSGAGTCVRGVLTITIPENADIAWIIENYDFISNPTAGETREIDVEIYVNTFTGTVNWSEMLALN